MSGAAWLYVAGMVCALAGGTWAAWQLALGVIERWAARRCPMTPPDTAELPPVTDRRPRPHPGRRTKPRRNRITPDVGRTFDEIVARNPDLAAVDVLDLSSYYIVPEEPKP